MPYVASAKLYAYGLPGDGPDAKPNYVIGKNLMDAAGKVPPRASTIDFVGTLMITQADMDTIFDPPPGEAPTTGMQAGNDTRSQSVGQASGLNLNNAQQQQPAVHDLLADATDTKQADTKQADDR